MRTIKFRLRVNNKIVGYEKWYSGETQEEKSVSAKPQWLYSKDGEYWNPEYIYHNRKDTFTGLLDKKGREIYEGDLLQKKDAEKPRVVKWTDQNGAYFVLSNSATKKVDWDDCLTDKRIKLYKYEVIGNIYETPELIK